MKDFSKKELAWVERLQKTLDAMPQSLTVFDSESGIAIYKAKELPNNGHSVDSSAEHESVSVPEGRWERGAW